VSGLLMRPVWPQQIEQGEHQEAPIMAFGGDEPGRSGGFGFFGESAASLEE
jgi:hypothetical protein